MPLATLIFSPRGRLLLVLTAAFAALLVTAAGRAWLSAETAAGSSTDAAAASDHLPQSGDLPQGAGGGRAAPQRLEWEHVTVGPAGFEPSEIRRPAGRFLLAVNDRSGLGDISLRLDALRGARLHEVRLSRDARARREWRQVLSLAPGTYVLTEAGRPDWACRITITPN